MDLTVYDLPLSGNLSIIETTEGLNGYPKNTAYGVVGFESFEDAELFAKQHNLEVVSFTRKNGHHFWTNEGHIFSAYNLLNFYSGRDDYDTYTHITDSELCDMVKDQIRYANEFDEILAIIERFKNLQDNINSIGDEEFVLENLDCYGDSRFEIMSNQVMQFNYDCDQNIIGVF